MIKLHTHKGEHYVIAANMVWHFRDIKDAWKFIFDICKTDRIN